MEHDGTSWKIKIMEHQGKLQLCDDSVKRVLECLNMSNVHDTKRVSGHTGPPPLFWTFEFDQACGRLQGAFRAVARHHPLGGKWIWNAEVLPTDLFCEARFEPS